MNMRILNTLGTICCTVALFSHSAQADTLKELYLYALENDHQYRAAKAELDAGLENKKLGRAGLLPQISGEASWSRYYPSSIDVEPESKEYFVGLSQNIVNLNAWYTYKRGKALTNVSQAQFAIAEQSLIIRTAQAYFDALKAVDNLISAKAEEDALSQQLKQTRQRFEVGLTAITEVHEAQAAFDSATANRLVAAGDLGTAFEALEVLTGRPHEQLAPLKEDFPVQPPEPMERTAWVDQALEENATLQASEFLVDVAKASAKAAKVGHLPTLSGSVGYSRSDPSDQLDPRENIETEGGRVQLNLNVPLYSGGSISATRRQSYSEFIAEQERYLETQRDVVQQTRSFHLLVLTSAATVKARAQAITSARSALEATQAGYDVGTRDLVDVLNAQRNVYRNERDYYDALYVYVMATLQLRQAAGMLNAEDIEGLNQWLDRSREADYSR